MRRTAPVLLFALSPVSAGCTSGDGDRSGPAGPTTIEARGGTGQIWVRTDPGARDVEPDRGYVVTRVEGDAERSEPITVTARRTHPEATFYQTQDLEEGFGYLTTRNGTKLAVNVTLPGPAADGPYPTVGMEGIDDPATAMLAVAALGPPDLAAIAPMGAVDDVFRSALAPGGVPNQVGIDAVADREAAARADGSEWATTRIDDGDRTCRDNQSLRGQNLTFSRQLEEQPFRWYLGEGGTLPPDQQVAGRLPALGWRAPASASSLAYVSPVLLDPVVMLGSASADLWISSSASDTDLQVTLTEVRPDGRETFVQSGWLRAFQRKLDERHTTELRPVHTQLEADARPLRADRFTPVRVEIFPFAHAFRVGSRIRITISAPGGDVLTWRYATLPGTQDNAVARSVDRPSSVVLPVVPGAGIPTPSPLCPSLRGQPCRTTQPAS